MKKIALLCLAALGLISCSERHEKTEFSQEVLSQSVTTASGTETNFGEILNAQKGKTTLVEVWASWCGDCIKAMPETAQFQAQHPELNYLFISVDKDPEAWRNGMEKYATPHQLKGDFILMSGGWGKGTQSAFTQYIELDWIPRYILLDEEGKIKQYYAKSIDEVKL
ncbi:TlpA family protein disulfide reductase [Ornithobacterium rhinotracheale]|uniref:TlpA family protein disulfide reductase n=1 Tax=Ornithobacterium rhinotracheale TaxID=28251 RepID=A0A410JU22_ORNRH|nr:TlpA disulfide reductase family protein [Ornithobacterium rhinotracheale]QAR31538.1 TlpA family protein disulfide reductase [Ornithobacterium rhinotracheale]